MNITLTSMQGNTKTIELLNRDEVYHFITLYKSILKGDQRVKITCDILGIDGYMQGDTR